MHLFNWFFCKVNRCLFVSFLLCIFNLPAKIVFQAAPVPSQAIPSSLTFYLIKTGQYENVTTVRYGDRVHYQLWVQFPSGNTDISVEIFSATNNTQIILTCNPKILSIGSNLNAQYIAPVLDSVNNYSSPNYVSITFMISNRLSKIDLNSKYLNKVRF